MDYEDYSNWKGWLNKVPFGSLSIDSRNKYKLQLDKLHVDYKNINALEIGFGNGGFIKFLLENGSNVEGIEIQESLLEEASNLGIPAHNSLASLTNGPYDLIVGFDVLEHLTLEQLQQYFLVFKSVLKPDGKMIFRFPNGDSFVGLSAQNGDFTHVTAIGLSKLEQLIRPLGFKIAIYEGALVYPRSKLKHLHFLRKFLRYLTMQALGFGSPYFFSGDIVTVLTLDHNKG
ncbi:bifunctional 2-polyprenyl-6-hydroxyphenol methylase/3-demethylubiquinol 3-O-methyltransferase UbiG [Polynucleobacter sp. AM-25C3]|uniref:class I SAM-dependent methyltransferase n=1 Tax=Polynucleobacter sp. AM-25C3 TaxID=1855569 RepID=UPI001C0C70EA|nr:class I SAM-dependent methyltransferase [Polynucleobacter sp. AM-25C3]MBU3601780.1 class I SAM-dependent methyltransferase [Polynucleobacter sp. AM-25C3]